jgi:hypothetical protein
MFDEFFDGVPLQKLGGLGVAQQALAACSASVS